MNDHRKLGRDLELFHHHPLVGAGLPLWLPGGSSSRRAIESFLYLLERADGYQHVDTPPLASRQMYERSGHLPHFAADMFPPMAVSDHEQAVLRPSLCPHHAMVYASRGRSYRELPLRIGETGMMFRAERSGVLSGLSRVRVISLNDGHIFCAPEQVRAEVARALRLMPPAHAALGFSPDSYRLSLRGDGGKYVDDPPMWDRAEQLLRAALDEANLSYVEAPGEAAFYGPKVDVQVRDAAGREWTLATVQVDYFQPVRFGLSYVDSSGRRQRPVMVHRSIAGSMERLFGHLLEVHSGALPAWYAPVQAVVVPVGPEQDAQAAAFARRCHRAEIRVESWYDGTVGARVREAIRRKIPYVAVIGAREAALGSVALRSRGVSGPPEVLSADAALALLSDAARPPIADAVAALDRPSPAPVGG